MIISRKHRYLFVELPHTASSAIHRELCEYYDGVPILQKHSYYHQFLEIASEEERRYFVFSNIRNPLDVTVTLYCKYKSNHKGAFTDPNRWKSNGGDITDLELKRFRFIQENDADFPTFFKRFHRFPPYDNWSRLAHKDFDFVIRYENLQADFSKALELMRIPQQRPLPVVNPTAGKETDFWSYYVPEIRRQAVTVFGPFLSRWGYPFPPEWDDTSIPWSSRLLFHLAGVLKTYFVWDSSFSARWYRRLRGL